MKVLMTQMVAKIFVLNPKMVEIPNLELQNMRDEMAKMQSLLYSFKGKGVAKSDHDLTAHWPKGAHKEGTEAPHVTNIVNTYVQAKRDP